MTTWSIDYAFMIDTGDLCTREEMERVGWDKTRDTVLVSEDLATGGIRAPLVSAKGSGDPWIAGKIKDDIEEFGYGGAPVRIKSDQEPAIVDVQRAVIAKRGNAPTVPVKSPVGDSQYPTDESKPARHGYLHHAESDLMHHQYRLSTQQWNPGPARRNPTQIINMKYDLTDYMNHVKTDTADKVHRSTSEMSCKRCC